MAEVVGYKGNRSVGVNSRFARSYFAVIVNINNLKLAVFTCVFGSGESNLYRAAGLNGSSVKEERNIVGSKNLGIVILNNDFNVSLNILGNLILNFLYL